MVFGDDGFDIIFGGAANDTIFGGDGIDLITGSTGDDQVFGGADADGVYGGTGNDTLGGGAGADTLNGNAGNDTITTGTGNDTIVFDRYGGDDVVTDFDLTDTDSNGFYNDQLDVSALRDLGGNPVNVDDVTVTNDGGFARLSFPEGESILLQGVTPAQMSTNAQLYAAGIPCFTARTLIRTPRGDVPIAALRIGDLVTTRDNGPQPILWVGIRRLSHADLMAAPKLRPIRISSGAFDNPRPAFVSPQHGMLLRHNGEESLVRATHLARMRGGKVRQAKGVRSVTYVHLLFESHQIIFGDDLPSESFYPGPCARDMLQPAQLQELGALFPDISKPNASFPRARPLVAAKTLPSHITDLTPAM